jgi:hypothetical protein
MSLLLLGTPEAAIWISDEIRQEGTASAGFGLCYRRHGRGVHRPRGSRPPSSLLPAASSSPPSPLKRSSRSTWGACTLSRGRTDGVGPRVGDSRPRMSDPYGYATSLLRRVSGRRYSNVGALLGPGIFVGTGYVATMAIM